MLAGSRGVGVPAGRLAPNFPSRRPYKPATIYRTIQRAASTSQSQVADVKRLKGIRMRPRTPEDDEKKVPPSVEYLVEYVAARICPAHTSLTRRRDS